MQFTCICNSISIEEKRRKTSSVIFPFIVRKKTCSTEQRLPFFSMRLLEAPLLFLLMHRINLGRSALAPSPKRLFLASVFGLGLRWACRIQYMQTTAISRYNRIHQRLGSTHLTGNQRLLLLLLLLAFKDRISSKMK